MNHKTMAGTGKRWKASELRKLPAEQRDAILEAAAIQAEEDYRNDPELTAIMNSHYSVPYENCLSELNSPGNAVVAALNGLAARVSTAGGCTSFSAEREKHMSIQTRLQRLDSRTADARAK
jgi:hypothetical protein